MKIKGYIIEWRWSTDPDRWALYFNKHFYETHGQALGALADIQKNEPKSVFRILPLMEAEEL